MEVPVLMVLILTSITQTEGQSLSGRQLEITSISSPPLVIVNNATVAAWRGKYEGILIDVLRELSSMANFTYKIHMVFDKQYGSESSPGVWTGMIGETMNNIADVAVAPLIVTASRAKVVTYTQPIMDVGIRILYRKTQPPVSNQSLLLLLAPFTTGLWFMIIVCFAVASFVFFVIGKQSPYEQQQDNPQLGDVSFVTTFCNTLLYSLSSFMHRDAKAVQRSTSGHVMSFFWWIFTTLIIITFAANFTALLVSKTPDIRRIPFTNFNELSLQSDVKYGTFLNGAAMAYFKGSKSAMEQRLWKQMNSDPKNFVKSIKEGIDRVRSDNYAFISEGPMAKYLTNRAPCDLMIVGAPIDVLSYGFVCGKNSDVCALLNPYILRLTQSHFRTATVRKWVNPGECSSFIDRIIRTRGGPVLDTFRTLGIRLETQMSFNRFSAAFFILLGGILLSLAVLGGEIFYFSKYGLPQK